MNSLLLIADDLTGAADCAAYAPAAGLHASIHLAPPAALLPAGLAALSSETRALQPAAAQAALATLWRALPRVPPGALFQKIDSLLRGNPGAEVAALRTLCGTPAVLICPALPAQGRAAVGGRLRGAPAGFEGLDVAAALAAQAGVAPAFVPLAAVQAGGEALVGALRTAAAVAPLLLADAVSDADLDALVAAWARAAPDGLLCGSAGLAAAWLRLHGARGAALPTVATPPVDLMVVGSYSAMARAQVETVNAVEAVHAAGGRSAPLLHLPWPATPPAPAEAAVAAQQFAELACAQMARRPVQHLLVAGGDTAHALLTRLGVTRLEVVATAGPGMPTCRATSTGPAPPWITLKAGSHGTPATLAALLE